MALGDVTVYGDTLTARLAYAAGVLDGEGYVGIKSSERAHVQRSRSHRVYVSVSNTDRGMIYFLKDNFGGSVEYKEFEKVNRKPMWRWRTSAKNAIKFLKLVLPFLITKKRQAEVAIKLQGSVSQSANARGISDEVLVFRDGCMEEIHDLNQRRI